MTARTDIPQPPDMARLAGAWRLVTIEQPDADGAMQRASVEGLLVLSGDGHMAVQVRNTESPVIDTPYSRDGYEASYGTITLDPTGATFVYRVEGALVADLVGQGLPRGYCFEDDLLVLTSTQPAERWRVLWRREWPRR
jgi:hypothetical protein